MTPLAHSYLKRLIRKEDVSGGDPKALWKLLQDIHCFEISEALPMIDLLGEVQSKTDNPDIVFKDKSFLPAPKTWIEWRNYFGRMAVLFIDEGRIEQGLKVATSYFIFDWTIGEVGWVSLEDATYYINGTPMYTPEGWTTKHFNSMQMLAHASLVVINTPKIVGRKQFMPHRGLEKELLKNQKWVGKFPLHAWTEIKLNIAKPIDIDDGEPHEAHLTGKRALHFCRAHLRLWDGKLIYVTHHWRGDPALGMKQSRYKLVA